MFESIFWLKIYFRGKAAFDSLALDCLQKIDLLAAARCNMFSHALVLYQNSLLGFTKKSAQAYSTIANSFKGYQRYDFMVVRELAETSIKLAQETGGDEDLDDKEKLLFLEEYQDVEEAQEAQPTKSSDALLDIDSKAKLLSSKDLFDEFFSDSKTENEAFAFDKDSGLLEMRKSIADLNLTVESLSSKNSDVAPSKSNFEQFSSENFQLLNDILGDGPSTSLDWDSADTFLPSDLLKQSLGDILNPETKSSDDADLVFSLLSFSYSIWLFVNIIFIPAL